ncbi:MAG: carbon-nitrogen family hydrolase [Actinobacteria bacterium]|nr:carbon-nitrogen family hydrolase [Actinomycetota bacterium]MCB9411584.1 carbon-nitrogen family hydrolase [Actinomycetota bacterium]
MRVAMVQLDLGRAESRPTELAGVEHHVLAAAERGAEFVILPELWRTGPFELEATLDLAEPPDGPTATAMAELASRADLWLHAGSVLTAEATESPDGSGSTTALYNTSLLFAPAGEMVTSYRKRHLFGFDTGEAALIRSGDEIVVVDTPLGRTGLATCYDLRFPEHFRALVDSGAEAVLLSSGWPARRISHWDRLTAARAIENQVNLVACNATGSSGDVELGGNSVAYDPWGEVLGGLDSAPGTLIVDVDPQAPTRVRAEFPVLRDRR